MPGPATAEPATPAPEVGSPPAPAAEPKPTTTVTAVPVVDPAPPPLDPPPSVEPTSRPSFLKTRDELDRAEPRQAPRRRLDAESDVPTPPARKKPGELPKDFVVHATPWVDFSLTSFWMGERADNFLNMGVQVGGYFAERVRLTARLIAPLEEASDQFSDYDFDELGAGTSFRHVQSRSVSVLYGVSAGLILSNSKTFLFAPGVSLWRTDVGDYGTTAALSLPFEWTTHRHLRVGFELALGHSFGGSVERGCTVASATGGSCGVESVDRPGGTAALLQYAMGWALSPL